MGQTADRPEFVDAMASIFLFLRKEKNSFDAFEFSYCEVILKHFVSEKAT
jgi:hypothetical protein